MSGLTTPDPRFNDPAGLAKAAAAFRLPLRYHGYWPNVQQAVGLAFRYENASCAGHVHLSARKRGLCAGSKSVPRRISCRLDRRSIFRPICQSIDTFKLGFADEILDKLLYGNAARLFNLGGRFNQSSSHFERPLHDLAARLLQDLIQHLRHLRRRINLDASRGSLVVIQSRDKLRDRFD